MLEEQIWKFIRSDMSPIDFDQWICSNLDFENILGKELYLDLVSVNFKDFDEIKIIKQKLKCFIEKSGDSKCSCLKIRDIDVINMGSDSDECMNSFVVLKHRNPPFWWLYLSKCTVCNTHWLVGQEERQNDVFCLKRLNSNEIHEILIENKWPNCFDTCEYLLRLGKTFCKQARFVDPFNSSLIYTVIDLATERPFISVLEISELINVDKNIATELSRRAIQLENVKISFN